MEKGPSHCRPGQVKQSGTGDQFGPSHSAFTGRAERFLVAVTLSPDLFIYVKHLLVEAMNGKGPSH